MITNADGVKQAIDDSPSLGERRAGMVDRPMVRPPLPTISEILRRPPQSWRTSIAPGSTETTDDVGGPTPQLTLLF
jgi:hypothetical protein